MSNIDLLPIGKPSSQNPASTESLRRQSPHIEVAHQLQDAYDFFNERLFEGSLPGCMITLQREKTSVGYFSHKRFESTDGQHTDEIAMNPSYFGIYPILETLQTLVHEMVHLWQAHFGEPGRNRYHNKQWANRMEAIGLMPSDTGEPGGKRTGDNMRDYVIANGRFIEAARTLITNAFVISWHDRFPPPAATMAAEQLASTKLSIDMGLPPPTVVPTATAQPETATDPDQQAHTRPQNRSNREKYSCGCTPPVNIWGKPNIRATCDLCNASFQAC